MRKNRVKMLLGSAAATLTMGVASSLALAAPTHALPLSSSAATTQVTICAYTTTVAGRPPGGVRELP